jgi:alkanesulfonate monooxygenase
MEERALRFGIWALVHGSRGAHGDPQEPYDASWERNRALVLEAERLGFDLVLLAQHTANPRDDVLDELEPWTAAAALAALTHRIELIAAIKPLLYHPVVLAKLALQIEHISQGRFALNLVNAWNRAELLKAGIAFPEHDERYAYGREWIRVVEPLLRGERVTHEGTHFQVRDYVLRPAGTYRPRPRIYVGGESEPARSLVAEYGDVWFINGRPWNELEPMLADLRGRVRPPGAEPLRFGLSAFVIARATSAEAHAHYQYLLALAEADAKPPRRRDDVDPKGRDAQGLRGPSYHWHQRRLVGWLDRELRRGRRSDSRLRARRRRHLPAHVPALRARHAQLRAARAASRPPVTRGPAPGSNTSGLFARREREALRKQHKQISAHGTGRQRLRGGRADVHQRRRCMHGLLDKVAVATTRASPVSAELSARPQRVCLLCWTQLAGRAP